MKDYELERRVAALEALVEQTRSANSELATTVAARWGEPCLCAKCQPEPQPEPIDDDLVDVNEADGVEEPAAAMYNDCQQRRFSDTPDQIRSWPPMREIKHEWLCSAYAALAALKSLPKPSGNVVAWMYSYPGAIPYVSRDKVTYKTTWTETPLYAAPPPAKPRLLTVEEVENAWYQPSANETVWAGFTAHLNAILQRDDQ